MAGAIYGAPPAGLALVPAGAIQLSPFVVGAEALEDLADGALDDIVIAAPPSAIERRFVLAHALRALKPGGRLVALAPKDMGGLRLRRELAAFGCEAADSARRHWRICASRRPDAPTGLARAIAEGWPQVPPKLGLWSQPGVFSWDRVDPGSALLAPHIAGLAGAGADLGCGVGVLALAALASPTLASLALIDLDRRAIEAARRNVSDGRASFLQADLRAEGPVAGTLDFVIMNQPFHDGGAEDKALGQAFIRRAAAMLKPGGVLKLVANVGLPYEAVLGETFKDVRLIDQAPGYKALEARR